MTPKEKMQQAQQLIKNKDYDAARKVLITVDHPKAREWMAKLDKIDPAPTKATQRKKHLRGIGVAILVVLVFAFSIWMDTWKEKTLLQLNADPTTVNSQVEMEALRTRAENVIAQHGERCANKFYTINTEVGDWAMCFRPSDTSMADQLRRCVGRLNNVADAEAGYQNCVSGFELDICWYVDLTDDRMRSMCEKFAAENEAMRSRLELIDSGNPFAR